MTRSVPGPLPELAVVFEVGAQTKAQPVEKMNDDLLEAAVREHAQLVFRIACLVLRNRQDAEDATQETFMRVLRYRRKLEGIRDQKSWLARIAWRVSVERRKQRDNWASEIATSTVTERLRSQLISGEQSTLGKELSSLLDSLIASLPEALRDALRLSTLEELSPRQIAEVLQVSESSVRSRIFRARQILKEKVAALGGQYGTLR